MRPDSTIPRPKLRASMLASLTLVVWGGLLPATTFAQDDQDRGSLQDLLRAARVQREAERAVLVQEVSSGLDALKEAIAKNQVQDLEGIRENLIQLGPGAAELLLEHLDPGKAPNVMVVTDPPTPAVGSDQKRLAANVVVVMRAIVSPAVTDDLIAMVQAGPIRTAQNALKVLAGTQESDRVVPEIRKVLDGERGQIVKLRGEALMTLSQLGGPAATQYLTEALLNENPDLVTAALTALTATKNAEAGAAVLGLVNSQGSQIYLREILSYYGALPELCVKEHQKGLIDLAIRRTLPRASGAAILDMLREMDVAPDRTVKKQVENLQDSASRELSEAALAWLASRGERSARRRLLAPYDDFVDKNEDNAQAYRDRGAVLYRIADYSNALRDYRDVLRLSRQSVANNEAYVGAAKSCARLGKFKDAQDLLQRSPLSSKQLTKLASDPAFAEMIAKDKYRATFRLDP